MLQKRVGKFFRLLHLA